MREQKGSTLGKKYQAPVDTRTFLVKGLQVHEGRVGRGSAFSHKNEERGVTSILRVTFIVMNKY